MIKKVILQNLTISNWRGQNIIVNFNDTTTTIKGKNGCGKSTLMEAWCWLISGYTNANANKNENLFDNKVTLSHETPKASVKATICIDDITYTIERVAEAKFIRKRGTNEYEKNASDSYYTYIDNIEISASDFNNWISSNLCDNTKIIYALDGNFFVFLCENDRKKSRKVLEEIVGTITPLDFQKDYSLINDELKKISVELLEEKLKNSLKPLEKRLSEIPIIVGRLNETLVEYDSVDYFALLDEINEKKRTINEIDETILGKASAIKPILGQRDAIFELINQKTLELNKAKNDYNATQQDKLNEIKARISQNKRNNEQIKARNNSLLQQFENDSYSLKKAKELLSLLQDEREKLLNKKNEIKSKIFQEDECPFCGQELPVELIEEQRMQFNKQKNDELQDIISRGKNIRSQIDNCIEQINRLSTIVEKGVNEESLISDDELLNELQIAESSFVAFEETSLYKKLSKEISDLNATMPIIPQNDNDALTLSKRILLDTLDELNRKYGYKDKADKIRVEINELHQEQKKVGCEIAKIEEKIAKCKEYIEERASIISDRINLKLHDCKIVMWETLKSGEKVPDCRIVDKNNVKYSTINHSNQIKLSIDIQRMFNKHYNINLPIWVDESDCFDSNNLPKIDDTQMIYLKASDDNYLIVE